MIETVSALMGLVSAGIFLAHALKVTARGPEGIRADGKDHLFQDGTFGQS